MKWRINYTGRRRIKREWIPINFNSHNGSIVSFDLSELRLSELRLSSEALIFVEVYYRTELERFEFGTVGDFSPPTSTDLTSISSPQNLKVRILVVDPDDKKILAAADRIAPEIPVRRRSILPVEFKDLGNRIWTVEYEGDEGSPILCFNSKIPDIQNIALRDSRFFMQVYPPVIREIVSYMVFVEGVDSPSDPSTDWHRDWLKFTALTGIQPPEILDKNNEQFDKGEALNWIDNVIEAFCNTYSQHFEEFVRKMEEGS